MRLRFFSTSNKPIRSALVHNPEQFRPYQVELARLMRTLSKDMSHGEMAYILRNAAANYHPSDEILQGPQVKPKQYHTSVMAMLFLAKQGLDIMNGENPGNPRVPYMLNEQHYRCITNIPALKHLAKHPEMIACVKRCQQERDEAMRPPLPEVDTSDVPRRLNRDW